MSKKNKKTSQEDINETEQEQSEETGQQESAANEEATAEEKAEPTIEEQLAASEERISLLVDQNLRQMAEFDNYRKRTLKEKAELIKNASADVLTKILPIIDDLERAIDNNAKSDDIDAIKEGFQLIYNKLMHTLEGEGLKKIPAKGEKFNTDFHEAIAIIPATEDNVKNTIIDCTRDGYMLNEKVLRTSQVVVAN